MPLDHSSATVTFDLEGLGLLCIDEERNRAVLGLLDCDRHTPTMDIQRVETDKRGVPTKSQSVDTSLLDMRRDLWIRLDPRSSAKTRVRKFRPTAEFSRSDARTDYEDFRWAVDLEGNDFHHQKLLVKDEFVNKPKLFFAHGTFYTKRQTDELFARVSLNSSPARKDLGRFAYKISADLGIDDGFIALSNRPPGEGEDDPKNAVILEKKPGVRYVVTIQNHCSIAGDFEGTDFRLFYTAVEDPRGITFDLRRMVPKLPGSGGRSETGSRQEFAADGFPQNCEVGVLGQSGGFGPN